MMWYIILSFVIWKFSGDEEDEYTFNDKDFSLVLKGGRGHGNGYFYFNQFYISQFLECVGLL